MKAFDLRSFQTKDPCVLALGFFDCVHLGHQRVISRAVSIARELGVKSAVFLFKNNIYELLGLGKAPLFSFEERLEEIEKLGVDQALYIEADASFLSESPENFLSFLKARLNVVGVVCGEDYSFGEKGKGNARTLCSGFPNGKNEIVPIRLSRGEKIGSGKIKSLLQKGDVSYASELLGRPFSVKGIVLSGRKDGKKIGFPTVNLKIEPSCLKFGVYFTNTSLDGKVYPSVTNVGPHPTFGDLTPNLETHLLDFDGDAYGKEIVVSFLEYDRDLKKVDTVESLVEKLSEDVRKRRKYDSIRSVRNG